MNIEEIVIGDYVELEEMLSAREHRVEIQSNLIQTYQKPIVSFTLNIVGPIKVFPLSIKAFQEGVELIETQCHAFRFPILHCEWIHEKTGYEQFWVIDCDAKQLKETLCRLEEMVSMGRLFDIDVISLTGEKVSRSEFDLPQRKCLLCGKDAFLCSRSRAHSVAALLAKECELMQTYFGVQYAKHISALAMQALLFEVSATPKPGLVDRKNTGAHRDMDIFTFECSAVSLHPYFEECVLCGVLHHEKSLSQIFTRIRPLGVQAEAAMLKATQGVNTHKGLIFSLGILCCALGYLYADKREASTDAIMDICQEMTKDVLDDFTSITLKNAKTHGERLFALYQIKGARGEALLGYPTVFLLGLPTLENYIRQGLSLNDAGILTLLHIIAYSEDTNLITRSSYEIMKEVQAQMKSLIECQDLTKTDYISLLNHLDETFIKQNISPGGSADILALTYFAYFIKSTPLQ